MSQRDSFDGGGLLALFGFEDEGEALPSEPQHLQPQPEPHQAPRAAPVSPPAQPIEPSEPRRRGIDLSDLGSDELVRAIVLADVLGPPPGRRGGGRR